MRAALRPAAFGPRPEYTVEVGQQCTRRRHAAHCARRDATPQSSAPTLQDRLDSLLVGSEASMSANVDYEAVAATYDRRYEQNVYPGTLGVLEAILRDRPGQRALEVGCGTGHWLGVM